MLLPLQSVVFDNCDNDDSFDVGGLGAKFGFPYPPTGGLLGWIEEEFGDLVKTLLVVPDPTEESEALWNSYNHLKIQIYIYIWRTFNLIF